MKKVESQTNQDICSFEKDCIHHNSEIFETITKIVKKLDPKKVLDIGICTGLIYKKYMPELINSGRVYGIDIDNNFLSIASKAGIHTKYCNIDKERIPFEDSTFDMVICDGILEHTLNPKGLMEEISRITCSRGTIILCVPNATSMIRRLDSIRGRSHFYSIIDNLFNRTYMKRCAILYSPEDLSWTMKKYFNIDNITFFDRKKHDPKTISIFICRLLSMIFPKTRDLILVVASNISK